MALCGAALFTFDFLHLVQTRIATIDTYGVFFILVSYYFMYRWLAVPAGKRLRHYVLPLFHSADIPLIADTTAIPFTEFSAKSLGVDIEIVSTTKYLSGGATSVGGAIIDYGTCPGFGDRIQFELMFNLGAYMTPHVAYMQSLGLETLPVRYQRQAASALTVAKALREHPAVKAVNYTGLEDNLFHELSVSQFGPTAGAMLTIDLADRDACFRFLNKLKIFKRATNLFDNKSLAIHPASTIFVSFTPEQRAEMDLYDTTIRLSIGLEDPQDLIDDIKQALQND